MHKMLSLKTKKNNFKETGKDQIVWGFRKIKNWNKTLHFVIWMDPRNITLSEISQRERERDPQILYVFTYMWNLQKQKQKQT